MMKTADLYNWIEEAKARPQDVDGGGLNVADTWVSPTHHYFCMTIPKAACSKIKLVLQQLEGLPMPPDPLSIHYRSTPGIPFVPSITDFATAKGCEILTAEQWFRFAFVRNPYARLFSAYKSQVMELSSPYVGYRESIRRRAGYPTEGSESDTPLGRVGFADFVETIAEQPDELRDGHWKSQVGTLHLEQIRYNFIGRVERFSPDFALVLERFHAPPLLIASLTERVNTTVALPLAAAYSKRLADLVYTLYRADFETFGYAQNSWMFMD